LDLQSVFKIGKEFIAIILKTPSFSFSSVIQAAKSLHLTGPAQMAAFSLRVVEPENV